MTFDKKIKNLEHELRLLKKELCDREEDLGIYKDEVKKMSLLLSEILSGMDSDLRLVKKVFKHLVPTQFPHISGFHFSTKFMTGMRFNGDYLDVFEQKDRFKFNLILSSSTSSALTALLIAFLLKYGRDLGGVASTPISFVDKVLAEIKNKNEKTSDIQLSCFLVDKKKYEVTYRIHGGVTVFFQCGETKNVRSLGEESSEGTFPLKAYDRLVVLSPGLAAAQNSKGETFSATPVLEAMAKIDVKQSVHDLRNDIFYRLDRHLGERKPMQDVSLIVMSVDNNIIKLV